MVDISHNLLQEKLVAGFGPVPHGFLDNLPGGKYFFYLSSCVENRVIFMEPSPERLTGYTLEEIKAGGLELQISRIHPEDLPGVYDKVLRNHQVNEQVCALGMAAPLVPLVLEYRIQRADGEWRDVQETRIYSFREDGSRDQVLGKVLDITERKAREQNHARKIMEEPKHEYRLLDLLLKYKKGHEKQAISPRGAASFSIPTGIHLLTKREKEVLQLIGNGCSTKQIANCLFISKNTVETHRRHLLEKLQVKNSVELIREASKAFWL